MSATNSASMARGGTGDPRGWLAAHRWFLLRRATQFGIIALFLAGPLFGLWIVKGNLASSVTLDVLPLTDPFVLLQSLFAGNRPLAAAFIGAAIVLAFYLAVGGRVYCAWVCPMNIVTDAAAWLRRRLGIRTNRPAAAETRYWLLAGTLAAALATGTLAWEFVNPVSLLQRGLIFGTGLGWLVVAAVFLYDLLVASRGWCGHLCPVGAFYGALGRTALLRVSASRRSACDDCMDCIRVCPEPLVIHPALKGSRGSTPVIIAADCSNCGRCIDVCTRDVFRFTTRFDQRSEP